MHRDWTRDEDYADIPGLDDGGLAWEFLRRNPDYVRDFAEGADVARWGLAVACDPALGAREAAPLWRWNFAPAVVVRLTSCSVGVGRDPVTAPELRRAASARADGEEEHLRFPNGLQALLEVGAAGCVAAVVPLDGDFLARATAARLLRAGVRRGWRPVSALSAPRRRRLALSLRALDGRVEGASYREIARCVLREDPAGSLEWRTSSVRAFVIRLCAAGRVLARGGYCRLLQSRVAAKS